MNMFYDYVKQSVCLRDGDLTNTLSQLIGSEIKFTKVIHVPRRSQTNEEASIARNVERFKPIMNGKGRFKVMELTRFLNLERTSIRNIMNDYLVKYGYVIRYEPKTHGGPLEFEWAKK